MIRRVAKVLLVLAAVGCAYVLMLWIWFGSVTPKVPYEFQTTADAVVILMGEVNAEFTDLGRQTIRRVNHGYDLYQSGRVAKILCVGGSRPSRSFSGAALMQQRLINKGVPAADIVLEPKSYDTRLNMRFAAEIAHEHQWQSVVIVSSPLHVYRIQRMPALRHWQDIQLHFSAFRYDQANPSITMVEKLRHAHYEWMSYLVYALPDSMYQRIVRGLREQDS